MGDTAKNIDWDPSHSTWGQTLTGGSGSVFKGGVDLDPRNSTLGQAAQGNWGEAARGAAGGLNNAINFNKDLWGGLLAPAQGLSDIYNSATGQPQAAERRKKLLEDQANADAISRRQADQQAQAQARQNAANQANQNYLNQQSTLAQSTADEDAYTAARNAARRARGTTLFGAWG